MQHTQSFFGVPDSQSVYIMTADVFAGGRRIFFGRVDGSRWHTLFSKNSGGGRKS
jgi:hypothetical protein